MADRERAEAEVGEEEYESDLDDAPLPALRRRDAASDDEGEEEEEEDGGTPLRRRETGSDADSDGQGAAEVYDEGAYEDGEEEEYEEYEEVYEEFEERDGVGRRAAAGVVAAARLEEGEAGDGELEKADEAGPGEEEEKKGNEPYAVPTTGAFYMHDDRFQEGRGRGRGRQRTILNSRKLWSPKEDQAWVHDRFDEIDVHDFHGDNPKRNHGGRFRGRGGGPGGRTRGICRGNFRGNRSRTYYADSSKNYSYVPKESHFHHDNTKNPRNALYDNGKNRVLKPSRAHYDDVRNHDTVPKESRIYYGDAKSQKNTPRVIRGRGSKRYQPRLKNTADISSLQNNKSQGLEDASSNANLVQNQTQTSSSQPEQLPIKQTIASNLSSASPPFYPSRPSNQEIPVSQGGNAQLSSTLLRGKAFVPSVGHVEAAMKGMNRPALHPAAFSSNGPFPVATNQVSRDFVQPAHPVVQQNPVQSPTHSVPRMPAQMFDGRYGNSNNISPVQPTSTVLSDDTEISSPSGSNKNSRLTVKGQTGDQGEDRTSFLYGGAHVLGATGAMGRTLGDQNFHGTPALLPVMQFGGQRPVGPGVPSIGMALPGFVSQQQLGLSNSEMTWLPILTGASGALGAPYGSSYIAVDGRSYYSRPSEQASSSFSTREPSASNASTLLKSKEIAEVAGDEPSQRQNKPRRYSEMNFGQ